MIVDLDGSPTPSDDGEPSAGASQTIWTPHPTAAKALPPGKDYVAATTMKILIVGNHTCGNRGDASILRGLIAAIESNRPDAQITVTSRYPVSSEYLLNRPVEPDVMATWFDDAPSCVPHRIRRYSYRLLVPLMMGIATTPRRRWLVRHLPKAIRAKIEALRRYDCVIQVGGSFFVDLYGYRQFETPFAAILADRPLLLIGHSMGPFGGKLYRSFVSMLLRGATTVALRESVSFNMMRERELPADNVSLGSDTAWLVPAPPRTESQSRPEVAITLRNLAPFDKRLGISQQEYERAFADIVNRIIARGYGVVACSTCTGIGSYHMDDRMPALRVRKLVTRPESMRVVMDELNDVDLGLLLQNCALLIGTRLHSAIIAMNFGTPAIALNYEHKSAGILADLGLSEFAMPVSSLLDGSLAASVDVALANISEIRERVEAAVLAERQKAMTMVSSAIAKL